MSGGFREHDQAVAGMFGRIARFYDLLNHVLSLGIDCWWRRELAASVWRPRAPFSRSGGGHPRRELRPAQAPSRVQGARHGLLPSHAGSRAEEAGAPARDGRPARGRRRQAASSARQFGGQRHHRLRHTQHPATRRSAGGSSPATAAPMPTSPALSWPSRAPGSSGRRWRTQASPRCATKSSPAASSACTSARKEPSRRASRRAGQGPCRRARRRAPTGRPA